MSIYEQENIWRSCGYTTDLDAFLLPCVKPVPGHRLRFLWTRDSFNIYELRIRTMKVVVSIYIEQDALNADTIKDAETRLVRAYDVLNAP